MSSSSSFQLDIDPYHNVSGGAFGGGGLGGGGFNSAISTRRAGGGGGASAAGGGLDGGGKVSSRRGVIDGGGGDAAAANNPAMVVVDDGDSSDDDNNKNTNTVIKSSSSPPQPSPSSLWYRRKSGVGLILAIVANAITYVAILAYSIHTPPVTYSFFASEIYGAPVAYTESLRLELSPTSLACPPPPPPTTNGDAAAPPADIGSLAHACELSLGRATTWQSGILAIGEGFGFLLGPAIGVLSDVYGRMRFLLLYIIGTFAAVVPLAVYAWTGMSAGNTLGGLYPYFAMAIIQGVLSPRSINDIVLAAGVGDAAPQKHYTWLTGLGQSGFAFGLIVGSVAASSVDTKIAYLIAIALFVVAMCIVAFSPDTLPPERRSTLRLLPKNQEQQQQRQCGAWNATTSILRGFSVLAESRELILLAVGSFWGSFGLFVMIVAVPPFFFGALRFTVFEYGMILVIIGLNMVFFKTIGAQLLDRYLGRKVAIVAVSFFGASIFVLEGLVQLYAKTHTQILIATFLLCAFQTAAAAPPLLISAALHVVDHDDAAAEDNKANNQNMVVNNNKMIDGGAGKHGRVQGALQGVIAIAGMAGSLSGAAVYQATSRPGALGGFEASQGVPFIVAAASVILTALPVLFLSRTDRIGGGRSVDE